MNECYYKKLPDIVDIGTDIELDAYITPVLVFGTANWEQRVLMLFREDATPVQAKTHSSTMELAGKNTAEVHQEPETPAATDTLIAFPQHIKKSRDNLKRKRSATYDSGLVATNSDCKGREKKPDGAIEAPKPPLTPEVEEPPTRKFKRAASSSSDSETDAEWMTHGRATKSSSPQAGSCLKANKEEERPKQKQLLCQQKITKGQHIWAQLSQSPAPVKEATIRKAHGNDVATTVSLRHMLRHQSCASHFEHAKATNDQRKDKYGHWLMGFDTSCPYCIPPLLERKGRGYVKDPFHYQVSQWAMENEHWANPGGWANSRNPPPIPVGAMKKKKGA
ncbi:g3627 [Coccomyxa elongata]